MFARFSLCLYFAYDPNRSGTVRIERHRIYVNTLERHIRRLHEQIYDMGATPQAMRRMLLEEGNGMTYLGAKVCHHI